jgi:signal transduction histidine kinase
LKTRSEQIMEFEYATAKGARFFHQRAVPVLATDGSVDSILAVARDITDRRAFEAELERLVAQRTKSLEETTKQLNDFCYSIAHDLKAPIRAQAAFAQVLIEDYREALGQEGVAYAKRIEQAADRQGNLVSDLLAHISLGRADLPMEPIKLSRAVELVRAELGTEARKKQAELNCDRLPGEVIANPASLHLLISNLLSNALKFVPPGMPPKVCIWSESVASEAPESFVRLWVEDNGIGIPGKYRNKLFGMFQRFHTLDQYPGTGMGLAIVKRAVERMGGRVGVESQSGQGSRFWVELKAAKPV